MTELDARFENRQRMESVWRGRASRLAKRPVAGAAGQDALPVIVLRIGDEGYGIDLQDVAEVLPPVRPTPVPGAADTFAGVINVQGEIRPVIDLGILLGIAAVDNGRLRRVVLLRKGGRELGLQTDTVERIRWIDLAELESTGSGDGGPSQNIASKFIRKSTKDLLMLLSTEALFAELNT